MERLKGKKQIEQLFTAGISVGAFPLRMVYLKSKDKNKVGVSRSLRAQLTAFLHWFQPQGLEINREVGNSFLEAYVPILEKRIHIPYTPCNFTYVFCDLKRHCFAFNCTRSCQ